MFLLPLIVVALFAAAANANDVYVIAPRTVSQETAAKELAHTNKEVYACQRLELKVTAKVKKVRGPKIAKK